VYAWMVTLCADTPAAAPTSPLKVLSNAASWVALALSCVRLTAGTDSAESIDVKTSTNGVVCETHAREMRCAQHAERERRGLYRIGK
jgi:hypothetical protein